MDPSAEIDRTFKVIVEELPGLIASVTLVIGGVWLLFDDAKDFGRFADEEHPSPFHHWQWGLMILFFGLLSLGLEILKILIKLGIIQLRFEDLKRWWNWAEKRLSSAMRNVFV